MTPSQLDPKRGDRFAWGDDDIEWGEPLFPPEDVEDFYKNAKKDKQSFALDTDNGTVSQALERALHTGYQAAQTIAYTRSVYNPDSDTNTYFVDAPADIAAKIQPSPEDEWRAWRKVALKSPTRDFTTYWLSGDLADTLRADLAASDGDKGQIVATFDRALEQIYYRAIQATRLDFEMRFEDVLREIRGGDLNDRRRAGTLFRSMIRMFGTRAYRDGLIDGGVLDGELDDEDTAELNSLIVDQSQYVSAFTEVLIKQDGISDNEAALKPTVWFNKSVMPLYQAGLASADRNSIYEWVYGKTEHCVDCLRLNGQRHRLRDYRRKGLLPQSDLLACSGFRCQCLLVKISGKARGNW